MRPLWWRHPLWLTFIETVFHLTAPLSKSAECIAVKEAVAVAKEETQSFLSQKWSDQVLPEGVEGVDAIVLDGSFRMKSQHDGTLRRLRRLPGVSPSVQFVENDVSSQGREGGGAGAAGSAAFGELPENHGVLKPGTGQIETSVSTENLQRVSVLPFDDEHSEDAPDASAPKHTATAGEEESRQQNSLSPIASGLSSQVPELAAHEAEEGGPSAGTSLQREGFDGKIESASPSWNSDFGLDASSVPEAEGRLPPSSSSSSSANDSSNKQGQGRRQRASPALRKQISRTHEGGRLVAEGGTHASSSSPTWSPADAALVLEVLFSDRKLWVWWHGPVKTAVILAALSVLLWAVFELGRKRGRKAVEFELRSKALHLAARAQRERAFRQQNISGISSAVSSSQGGGRGRVKLTPQEIRTVQRLYSLMQNHNVDFGDIKSLETLVEEAQRPRPPHGY